MFHPFYVKDESKETLGNWVAASNLKKGDELLTEDGKNIKVSEVRGYFRLEYYKKKNR